MNKKIINKYISVNLETKNKTGEIFIYGDIVDNKWWEDEVTVADILSTLNDLKDIEQLDLRVNCYGGSVVAGNAIFNALDRYRQKNDIKITAYNDGICASMATGIICVADKIISASNAMFMYHKPLTFAMGNADDLEKAIEMLNACEVGLMSNYMRKFNGTEDEMKQMLADETWLTADEAKAYGFVDEVTESVEMVASANGLKVGNEIFNEKIAGFLNKKYPNNIIEKEKEKVKYDEKLKDYGIDEKLFNSFIENENIDTIVDMLNVAVKKAIDEIEPVIAEPTEPTKPDVAPPTQSEDEKELKNKAKAFDKIIEDAKADALKNAVKAEGDDFDETRTKKYLNALDYSEIVAQNQLWVKKAENALNAGVRVSERPDVSNSTKYISKQDLL